jgi:hypothetical protein
MVLCTEVPPQNGTACVHDAVVRAVPGLITVASDVQAGQDLKVPHLARTSRTRIPQTHNYQPAISPALRSFAVPLTAAVSNAIRPRSEVIPQRATGLLAPWAA